MNHEIKTIELAKVYENQGYYQDALDIYTFLDGRKTSNSTQAAIKRMENKITQTEQGTKDLSGNVPGQPQESTSNKADKVPILIEQWLMLLVLKQRLNNFKKIKARF